MNDTLFSDNPVTWSRVRDLYGELAQVGGVRQWYHPERGWQDYPATSSMATPPEKQIQTLAAAGATHIQLYVDVPIGGRDGFFDTRTPDFLITELLQPLP